MKGANTNPEIVLKKIKGIKILILFLCTLLTLLPLLMIGLPKLMIVYTPWFIIGYLILTGYILFCSLPLYDISLHIFRVELAMRDVRSLGIVGWPLVTILALSNVLAVAMEVYVMWGLAYILVLVFIYMARYNSFISEVVLRVVYGEVVATPYAAFICMILYPPETWVITIPTVVLTYGIIVLLGATFYICVIDEASRLEILKDLDERRPWILA